MALQLATTRRLRAGLARRIQTAWRAHRAKVAARAATAAAEVQATRQLEAVMRARVPLTFAGDVAGRVHEVYAAILIQATVRRHAAVQFVRRMRRCAALAQVRNVLHELGLAIAVAASGQEPAEEVRGKNSSVQ